MNRGLSLALLLLAFVAALVGADTVLLKDAVAENEAALFACAETDAPSSDALSELREALARNRAVLSVSVSTEELHAYETALLLLEGAARTGDAAACAEAYAEATAALAQIKRSARFSFEQIL